MNHRLARSIQTFAAVLLLVVSFGASQAAEDAAPVAQAKAGMQRQIDLLDSVKP